VEIKNRQQMLIVAAIAAVALLVGDKLVFKPLTATWDKRARQIKDLRERVRDGQAIVRREQVIRSRWEHMQANTLTNNASAAEQRFFSAIDSWAQNSRASILAVTPQWRREAEDHATYECRVDASGNLSSLSRFIYEIQSERMAVNLESVELTARDKEGQQLALTLQISGLVLTSKSQGTR
jgi:hypothetical protein